MRTTKALAAVFALVITIATTMSFASHPAKHRSVASGAIASGTPVPICPAVTCPTQPASH